MTPTEIVRRCWAADPALWTADVSHHAEIRRRLGWLTVAEAMRPRATELLWFARDARAEGYNHAALLAMGGSSLAPEVLRRVFGPSPDGLGLTVLDTTDPTAIGAAEAAFDVRRTLFLVSSKSGGTIEVDSLFRHFWARTGGKGEQFVAITDPGTGLERLATWDHRFRRVFLNPPEIGGRYSVLSYFGLVPAALLGVDVGRLLDSALVMQRRCGPGAPVDGHPGLELGLALGRAALAGRDKVTLVADPRLESVGLWIEQLLAESTGKEGRGLIPVAGEPLGPPEAYGADRCFVSLALGAPEPRVAAGLAALEAAGHPVIRLAVDRPLDLGGEFFRWEFATAVAGAVLGIDPFDQPNVQEAKDRTKALLAELKTHGRLPEVPAGTVRDARELLAGLAGGRDYLGVLAFVPFADALEAPFRALLETVRARTRAATTFGYGPRYLHSTGQLHKGGPDSGAFLVVTCDHARDLPVPDAGFTFAQLQRAQALGDLASLAARHRRVVRLHLAEPTPAAVERLAADLRAD